MLLIATLSPSLRRLAKRTVENAPWPRIPHPSDRRLYSLSKRLEGSDLVNRTVCSGRRNADSVRRGRPSMVAPTKGADGGGRLRGGCIVTRAAPTNSTWIWTVAGNALDLVSQLLFIIVVVITAVSSACCCMFVSVDSGSAMMGWLRFDVPSVFAWIFVSCSSVTFDTPLDVSPVEEQNGRFCNASSCFQLGCYNQGRQTRCL